MAIYFSDFFRPSYLYLFGGFHSHGATPKSSIYRWISLINHPFLGVPPCMETPIYPCVFFHVFSQTSALICTPFVFQWWDDDTSSFLGNPDSWERKPHDQCNRKKHGKSWKTHANTRSFLPRKHLLHRVGSQSPGIPRLDPWLRQKTTKHKTRH